MVKSDQPTGQDQQDHHHRIPKRPDEIFDKDGALSKEFLLSRGSCCDTGCKNCPYKNEKINE